ncbi:putative disease resistance protein RGA1 [Silene latifolia]|uniref:putative disease resistance protein RGA1 n=1 Tax=Silene latifolia TaxID=37657 RepID=UPI003D7706CD
MHETETVSRIEKSLDSIVAKRVNDQRLRETHGQLWKETRAELNKLKTIETLEDKNRIIWEDSKAKIIDCMEKLTTPCPFNKQEMFGRDKEISGIKEELLNKQWGTSIIIIRGETGTGKTMLAQYLFEDPQVSKAFHIRDWINCNDIKDRNIFEADGRYILAHVIMTSYCCLEGRNRYPTGLIVFDAWPQFTHVDTISVLRTALSFIVPPKPMCLKILVTTGNSPFQERGSWRPRSDTATTTFNLLKGLQDDEPWALFESLAFSSEGSKEEKTRILESKIGLKVLNMCGNNPCVIKTTASILSSKITLEEWKQFIEDVWPSLHFPVETITSNLNLVSFKRLPFSMKRCLCVHINSIGPNILTCLLYCSLFPKDYEFNKVDLNLWLAIEFEIPSESIIEVKLVGEEYLRKLHKMGYLIEYSKIDDDDTLSYKMPSFSYEFVKNMAKEYNEYQSFGSGDHEEHVDPETIRHLSFIVDGSSWHAPSWLGAAKNLRSLLFLGKSCETISGIENIITSLRLLQIFNMTMVNCEKLASDFGNLEMLRSLRLGKTSPDFFTKFVTRMPNLCVLDIQHSNTHIIFGEEFQKLQNLRHLYVGGNMLDELSPSCGELLSLSKSIVLMMSKNNALHKLVDYNYIIENQIEDYYSTSDKISDDVYMFSDKSLIWPSTTPADADAYDDIVFKTLQAPLKSLTIRCWKGLTLPRFMDLASIQIIDCHKCEYCHKCECLPLLGTLLKLKSLSLSNLTALKYIENIGYPENKPYFPCLESLMLANLPKLEAWKDYEAYCSDVKLIPKLIKLQICSTKISFLPVMGNIASLEVEDISVKLLKDLISSTSSPTSSFVTSKSSVETLKTLTINTVGGLTSLSIKLPVLQSLVIRHCHELATLVVESPSLESFELHECGKLKELSMVCQDIAQLTKLEIECCPELDLHTMIPWKSLINLEHLTLMNLAKLECLPDDLRWLAGLKIMSICWIYDIKALPEWICSLRHLQQLIVRNCPSLITIPESLREFMNNSRDLQVEFVSCHALKKFPRSLPRNHLS